MENLIKMPKTKRGQETLNKILNAAVQVFYEKGYHNSMITDIVSLAGVASGTFYIYFEGKYELYKFLLLQCSHKVRKQASVAIQNCKTRREMEEVGLRAWLEFIRENRYIYRIIWESLYIDPQLFREYYFNFSQSYIKGLDKAKEEGEIREDINSEVLAYSLMGISNFLGLNWCIFDDRLEDFDTILDSFSKILESGIYSGDVVPRTKKPTVEKSNSGFMFDFTMDVKRKASNDN